MAVEQTVEQSIEMQNFRIVPRPAIPMMAGAAALLVVGIATQNVWLLTLLHLGGGATWMVLDVFLGFILGPILNTLSYSARVNFAIKLMPKMLFLMPTAVTVTLAAGWALANKIGTLEDSAPQHSWLVASFFIAAFLEIAALGFLQPANVSVLIELRKPMPNARTVQQLMRRFTRTALYLAIGQIAMLIIMARVVSM